MTRKSGKHLHAKHCTAVSTLLGLISSAHRDLHHWRSNQQPKDAAAETLPLGHRFMPHISEAEFTSHGELRDFLLIFSGFRISCALYIYIYIYIYI